MSRHLVLLLATAVLVAEATIPVANGRPMYCSDRVTVKRLGCGACTVADVLKVTGLSLFDFLLLQNGRLSRLYPTTVIDPDVEMCIAGYFS